MNLTFAEDFTNSVSLDSQLLGAPDSGFYWNRGVHPSVTLDNLLTFLPKLVLTFDAWGAGNSYGIFLGTRKRSDIVLYDDKIYQSLTSGNAGNIPASSPLHWLETNLDSLRLKSFIWSVEDNALSALAINRILVENQYLYEISERPNLTTKAKTSDFFGWAWEPKGSDYLAIRINQIAFTAKTTTPQNLYVINQGILIDTLVLTPSDGALEFKELNYTFKGKGRFDFIVEGQDVYSDSAYNDPLRYKGFVCYPLVGNGTTVEDIDFSYSSAANGLNFNVSCYLDSSTYIENNKIDLGAFYQAQFAYDFFKMMLHNSNNRFNIEERDQGSAPELVAAEALDVRSSTVARRYHSEKKRAVEVINRTFDKFLQKKQGFRTKRRIM